MARLHNAANQHDQGLIDNLKAFQNPNGRGHHFYSILQHEHPAEARDVANTLELNSVFTKETLANFLEQMPKLPEESRAIFLVKSTNHAVALIPKDHGQWELFNPSNTETSTTEKFENSTSLSEALFTSLYNANKYDEKRQGNLAINFSLLHQDKADYTHSVQPFDYSKHAPILPGMSSNSVQELSILSIESNDNTTLRRVLDGKNLSDSAYEHFSRSVKDCGFYEDRTLTKAEILEAASRNDNQELEHLAKNLNCSVIDLLPYSTDIRRAWISR